MANEEQEQMNRCGISWLVGSVIGGAIAYHLGAWSVSKEKSK